MRQALPHSHFADAFLYGNLFVAVTFRKAKAEDALLAFREMADNELHDVLHPLVFCFLTVVCCHLSVVTNDSLMPETLQATVADARHQITFLSSWQQNGLATKQALEDIATDILALLLVVQQGARHPLHLAIMLQEQPLDSLSFHHVFTNITPQRQKKLTLKAKFDTKVLNFEEFDRLLQQISAL